MSKHGIVHIEIPANDPKGAGDFYRELFGWEINTDDQFEYTMFRPQDGPGGGFNKVDGESVVPGGVLIYVDVDDIEGTLAQIESLGGATLKTSTEIPGMGHFAVFRDPTGNTMALWHSLGEAG